MTVKKNRTAACGVGGKEFKMNEHDSLAAATFMKNLLSNSRELLIP